MKHRTYLPVAFSGLILIAGQANAQFPFPNPGAHSPRFSPAVVLTENGKALEAKYTSSLTALQAELEKEIPKLDEAKVAAWLQAIQAEEEPENEATAKAKEVEKWQGAEGRLRDSEEQLKYAPQTLEDAQEDLARARARGEEDPERTKMLQSAENFLKSRQGDIDRLKAGIEKAKQEVEDAKVQLPEAIKAAATAKQAHEMALANTWKAMDALGVGGLLSSDTLDAKLAQYTILKDATPAVLAEFAQQSPENQKLLDQLFADKDLMLQMVVNDGAEHGRYGQAMKIYTDIQKASPKAKDGVYQRLAMATCLAHAMPIEQRVQGGVRPADEPKSYIDPVQRYLSFEKWYDAGELNVCFKDLNVWNLRRVVDCIDPDEMMVWARQMMRTLRPDCVPSDDDSLVFVNVTDHEIAYGSGGLVNDLPDKHFMQNILANGGICGRRGFFTRFILQSFGVPSTERVEPGHSAVTLWHPSGWQTRLGHNWGKSNRGFYAKMGGGGGNYGADVNFLASSQARENATAYMRVKRAQWIGSVVGEFWKPGLITWSGKNKGPAPLKPGEVAKPSAWSDIALHEQRRIIAQLEALKSPATPSVAKTEPAATGKASVDAKGVITIPSAACSSPTESKRVLYKGRQADLVVFLKNKEGKTVLHMSRYAKAGDTFEYTFDAPKAGKYKLVVDIATPMPNRKLFATANGGTPVEMALPYTIGLWGKTEPVEVELKAGSNVLKFSGPARVNFDQLTLTPVK
jgi:hypothetical protein